MKTSKELAAALEQKRGELAEIFGQNKNEAGQYTFNETQLEEVNRRNDELTGLGKDLDHARLRETQLQEIADRNTRELAHLQEPINRLPFPAGHEGASAVHPSLLTPHSATKSLGDRFIEAAEYKARLGGAKIAFTVNIPEASLKTTMTTAAGFAPFSPRTDRVVDSAQRTPVIQDYIPQDETTSAAVKYMEETTFTNAAAPVAENAAKPESALQFTERSSPVEKIATWLPVTDEQLEDVPQVRGLIDNRLILMLLLKEEDQIINGNGTTPQLMGLLTKVGVQTQARGTDPIADCVYKGITLVRHTGFARPDLVVFHPNDWQDVRLTRTSDGLYLWGQPSESGPERIWGLPVVITTAMAENTALVGDFRMYAHISRRLGITIEVSNSHSDFFIYNKQAVRAESRLSLEIFRAAAFTKCTGL